MWSVLSRPVLRRVTVSVPSFTEERRRDGASASDAARKSAVGRLRPILMTSVSMLAGMVPMALAFGEGGEQNARSAGP